MMSVIYLEFLRIGAMKQSDVTKHKGTIINKGIKPSPDNQGIELEHPVDVDEAAAEANRDIGALQKKDAKKDLNKNKKLRK